VVALPFIVVLCFKNAFLMAICLLCATNILAFIRIKKGSLFTLPTPFYRYPFEFAVGFRQYLLLVLGIYALALIGVFVGNTNLSLVCLGGISLLGFSFYINLEPDFYIWIFADSPERFLKKKFYTANFYTLVLGLPISVGLFCYDTALGYLIFAVTGLGFIAISAVLSAKYASYPNQISVPTLFLLFLCFVFPPFALVFIPYFYIKAKKRLSRILYYIND
jgi:hypothetical protein